MTSARVAWEPAARCSGRLHRRAFTLVELLVVILIIGMILALVLPAVFRAQQEAQNAAVGLQIDSLEAALEQYIGKYGLPPDFAQPGWAADPNYQAQVMQHVRRRWPRYAGDFATMRAEISSSWTIDINQLDAAEALVFWLGGIARGGKPSGFFANPRVPFGGGSQREPPLFEFKETQLVDRDMDGWLEFYPEFPGRSPHESAPFVYFAAPYEVTLGMSGMPTPDQYTVRAANGVMMPVVVQPQHGVALPYVWSAPSAQIGQFINATSYQLLCAGQDQDFGQRTTPLPSPTPYPRYPSQQNFTEGDRDNLANFSRKPLEAGQ